jgi:ankyrin repeat protein
MGQQEFLKACKSGDMQTLQSLDYSRIDIHACDEWAFQLACKYGHLDVVKYLISLEPDHNRINIHADDEDAFQLACYNGHLDVVKYLISLEPDHNHINIHANNEDAFRWACQNGHLDVVKYLISLEPSHESIDIHADDEYAFEYACKNSHLDVVKFLLSLEPERGFINIHAHDNSYFNNSSFLVKRCLIKSRPNYPWQYQHVQRYPEYLEELSKTIDRITRFHLCFTRLDTEIMESNVVGIISSYLI